MSAGKSNCLVLFALAAAFLAAAPCAHATDGVTLINQATALNGLPGCPNDGHSLVTICNSGSYRLASNLVGNNNVLTVIAIDASHVNLDLNGFSISTTSPGQGFGVLSNQDDVTVENGKFSNLQQAVELDGRGEDADHLSIAQCGNGVGIGGGMVEHVIANVTGVYGIAVALQPVGASLLSGQVLDCTVDGGLWGIEFTNGSGSAVDNLVSNTQSGAIAFFRGGTHGLISRNIMIGSGGFDISPTAGTSLGDNVCSNGSRC